MAHFVDSVFLLLAGSTLRLTVLLALAVLVGWLLRRSAASLRHRLWAGCVVLALALPALSAALPPLPVALLPADAGAAGDQARAASGQQVLVPGGPPRFVRGSALDERGTPSLRALVGPAGVWRPATGAGPTGDHGNTTAAAGQGPGAVAPPAFAARLAAGAWAVWLVGAALVGRRLWRARRSARRLLTSATPADPALWPALGQARALETDAIDLPMTIGALRPVILLPRAGRQWAPGWRRSAVLHERAHLAQRDPLLQALAEVATALYWFHPLVHLAARQLRIERELAADDHVLLAGHRGSDYAQLLVTLACTPDTPPATGAVVPLLTPAGLKARLLGILDSARPRAVRRLAVVAGAALAGLLLVPLAAAMPVGRSGPAGPAPAAGAEVDVLLHDGAVRVAADDRGLVRMPAGRGQGETSYALYARRGQLAARKGVLLIPYGTQLPVDLSLRPAPTLRGQVVTSSGAPVARTSLHVVNWLPYSVGPGGGPLATSGDDGHFALPGLIYGRYTLVAIAPGGASIAATVEVGEEDPPAIRLTVPDATRATGWLRDDDGRALAGVRIEPLTSPGFPHSHIPAGEAREGTEQMVTAADGGFRVLPLGRVLYARAQDREGRTIEALFSDGGLPYVRSVRRSAFTPPPPSDAVILQRPALVSVVVRRRDGRPVPHASFFLRSRAADANAPMYPHFADAQGRSRLVAVPPGRLQISSSLARVPGQAPSGGATTLILAPGERRENIEILIP